MAKAKNAFYAVKRGRKPGIYLTWAECEAQVSGFPGAVHKSFKTRAEAADFIGPGIVYSDPGSAPDAQAVQADVSAKPNLIVAAVPDAEGWFSIYTDGACKGNGQVGSVAGVGVWFADGDQRNLSERCPGVQTNNRAELIAIIRALEMTDPEDRIIIKTDSAYSQKCIEEWLPKWKRNNWRTSNGEPVKNLPLLLYLDALRAHKRPGTFRFQKVKAHVGIYGNECADQLAGFGCGLPWRDELLDEWDVGKIGRRTVEGSQAVISAQPNARADPDLSMFTADDFLDDDELAAELAEAEA